MEKKRTITGRAKFEDISNILASLVDITADMNTAKPSIRHKLIV